MSIIVKPRQPLPSLTADHTDSAGFTLALV